MKFIFSVFIFLFPLTTFAFLNPWVNVDYVSNTSGSQDIVFSCPYDSVINSVTIHFDAATGWNNKVVYLAFSGMATSSITTPSSGNAERKFIIPEEVVCLDGTLTGTLTASSQFRFYAHSQHTLFDQNTPVGDMLSLSTIRQSDSRAHLPVGRVDYTLQLPDNSQTIYVPIQSQLTDLQCVTNSPTSTCAFTYSTTTASSTPDYSRHFDLFLLFVGVLFFAVGVGMFRSLAKKYL